MTQTPVSDPGPVPSGPLQNLITIVTTHAPQTQAMAMVLTLQAAGQGARVQLLLCGAAGDLALKDAPASATTGLPPKGASPQDLLQMIREKTGATVEVCALYLPGKGLDASALLDGVTVADPATMAAQLMAADTRVLNF